MTEKIDIYFDRQPDESESQLRAGFKEFMSGAPQHLKDRIGGGGPDFKDDTDILPLQAADLLAWHFRRNIFEHDRGRKFTNAVWHELLNLERMTGIWSKEKLANWFEEKRRKAFVPVQTSTMTLPDPSSGWGS